MKLEKGSVENLVLAAAALIRLNKQMNITHYLHPDICLPGSDDLKLTIRKLEIDVDYVSGPIARLGVRDPKEAMA